MDKSTRFLWASLLLPLLLTSVSPYMPVPEDILCRPGSQAPGVLGLEQTGNYSAVVVEIRPRLQPLSCPVALWTLPDHGLTVTPVLRELPPAPGPRGEQPGSCSMQATMSPSEEPYWLVDLCNRSSARKALFLDYEAKYGGLLSWNISEDAADSLQVTGLLFTSLTYGVDTCSKPGMVPCYTYSGSPVICVSPWLACDGIINCPTNNWDESQETCSQIDQLRRLEGTEPAFDIKKTATVPVLMGALILIYLWWKRRARKAGLLALSQQQTSESSDSEHSDSEPYVYRIAIPEDSRELLADDHIDQPPSDEELDQPPDYIALYPQQHPAKTHSSA